MLGDLWTGARFQPKVPHRDVVRVTGKTRQPTQSTLEEGDETEKLNCEGLDKPVNVYVR